MELIAERLQAGEPVRSVARSLGVHSSTVSRAARKLGVDVQRCATERATAAKMEFDAARRLEMINAFADKAAEMLPTVRRPIELQHLTTALAILIDKRRLEEGEATARTEVTSHGAREELARRIDELAARRAAKRAAG
ncbi:MAG: helix-turn-helix domain-containing protein [Candidatus Rokubacteria bacterium]|nr:helix-turn-helix domain-containing protein [Candidatus Rokubacteria bacterium]